eukprot:SAG31_NODE_9536_length_1262_cov_1.006879_1_plen_262_part_00
MKFPPKFCCLVAALVYLLPPPSTFVSSSSSGLHLPAPPKVPPTFRWLDEEHRISVARSFLSKAERDHLLALVQDQAGGWAPTPTGGPGFLGPANSTAFQSAVRVDPVVARLEGRIANYTGIAPHGAEDMLSIAKIRSRGNSIRGGYYAPFGLHHETDGRPYRAVTILIYLKAPKEGGRTIFPLCKPPADTEDPLSPAGQLYGEFQRALESMWGGEAQQYARQAAIDPQAAADHPFMDLLEASCRGTHGISMGRSCLFSEPM